MTGEQQKVYDALMAYCESHQEEKNFVARDFVAHMEPVFREIGCRQAPEPGKRPRILVLRDDAAGDFILASAFLRELRRIYPAAHITLLASERNLEFARCCPYVDNLLINDTAGAGPGFWKVYRAVAPFAVEQLLPLHFDLAFSGRLGIYSVDVLLMYMSGAFARVAYTQDRPGPQGKLFRIGWDVMMTHALPFRQRIESDVDRDLFLLEGLLHLPIADRRIEVWTLAADREAAERAVAPLRQEKGVKRLYALMPAASEPFREWPVERFGELMGHILAEERDVGLVILGGAREQERCQALAAKFPRRALSLAGRLSFRESAEAIGLCEKYIGDDTGLAHVAAAKHVPVLDIFPFPASIGLMPLSCPVRFQPYGVPAVSVVPPEAADSKCNRRTGTGCAHVREPHCILGVTVRKMLEGYRLLNKSIREGRVGALILK